MPSRCWLCQYCDRPEIVEMMRFVEEKSPVMHVDVIATEIVQCLRDAYPDNEDELTEDLVKQHLARHVVTPVASITRITRDLLDMCESLRPTQEAIAQRRSDPAPKRRRTKQPEQDLDDSVSSAGSAAERFNEEEIGLYLRTVGQVMQIYRLHGKMLQPPT